MNLREIYHKAPTPLKSIFRFVVLNNKISRLFKSKIRKRNRKNWLKTIEDIKNFIVENSFKEGLPSDPSRVRELRKLMLKQDLGFASLNVDSQISIANCLINYRARRELPTAEIANVINRNNSVNPDDFLKIYDFFRHLGLYSIGLPFREIALKSTFEQSNRTIRSEKDIVRFFTAALEIEYFQSYGDFVKELSECMSSSEPMYNRLRLTGAIWFNQQDDFLKNFEINRTFKNYIKDKSIAIVGPVASNSGMAKEIDHYDCIIRFNYDTTEKGCDPLNKGMRTNLTYFNGEFGDNFITTKKEIPKDLDWLVFKKKLPLSFKQIATNSRTLNIGIIPFHGGYNLLQICLIDLLLHSTSNIKIFDNDLMLTVKRQKGYYPGKFEYHGKERYLQNIGNHDPITNFVFTKHLFKNKIITGDNRLERVLNMSSDEYAQKLQENYQEI